MKQLLSYIFMTLLSIQFILVESSFAQQSTVDKSSTITAKSTSQSSGYIRLKPDQWEKLKTRFDSKGIKATETRECRLVNCKKICEPGSDPPNEHRTITGCSSCYSWYYECDLVCK